MATLFRILVCISRSRILDAIRASLQKIWESHSIPITTKIRLMKAVVWPVTTYGWESWTLGKNEETRLDAFDMKGMKETAGFMDNNENK